MRLRDIIEFLKGASKDVKLTIDRADPELIAEAIILRARHRTYSDAQIIGTFHHYTIEDGHVKVELITMNPPDENEVRAADYMGYTLSEYRAQRGQ